jgi:hypothetical protein
LKKLAWLSSELSGSAHRRFQFQKNSQFFIGGAQ